MCMCIFSIAITNAALSEDADSFMAAGHRSFRGTIAILVNNTHKL